LLKEIIRNLVFHEVQYVDALLTTYEVDLEKNLLLNEMQARFVSKYGRERDSSSIIVKPINLLMQFQYPDERILQQHHLIIPVMKYVNVKEDNNLLLQSEFVPIHFVGNRISACNTFLFNDCFVGELCALKAGIEVKLQKKVAYFIQCRVISKQH
jgi:hypothetical protein